MRSSRGKKSKEKKKRANKEKKATVLQERRKQETGDDFASTAVKKRTRPLEWPSKRMLEEKKSTEKGGENFEKWERSDPDAQSQGRGKGKKKAQGMKRGRFKTEKKKASRRARKRHNAKKVPVSEGKENPPQKRIAFVSERGSTCRRKDVTRPENHERGRLRTKKVREEGRSVDEGGVGWLGDVEEKKKC